MTKKKSSRNKTIDLTIEEGQKYLDRTIEVNKPVTLDDIKDKTIIGDTAEVVRHIPKESFELIVADPPYNLSKEYHGKSFTRKSNDDYKKYTENWLSAVLPLLKENGTIYICSDYLTSIVIGEVLTNLPKEYKIQNRITWQREKGRGAKRNWKNGMEDIWFVTKGNDYTFNIDDVKIRRKVIAPYKQNGKPKDWEETESGNFRDTFPSNFWDDITIPFWSMAENTQHPTQKSEKLLAKLILASSNEGDFIFDPFLGSGTTSVTAKKLNRHYSGVEINPQYGVWIEKRLENADFDSSIQGYEDGVFWERNTKPQQTATKKEENTFTNDSEENSSSHQLALSYYLEE